MQQRSLVGFEPGTLQVYGIMCCNHSATCPYPYLFKAGSHKLHYKYLGFYIDEYMKLIKSVKVLAESAGRALVGVTGGSKRL